VNLEELLKRLLEDAKIVPQETRTHQDGTREFILAGNLPAFPHGGATTWYVLVVLPGETEIHLKEVEAILRHFWQYQLDWFEDDERDERPEEIEV
jgi:hypothetical protein